MFKLIDNAKLVNVELDYLRFLHDKCDEVYYKSLNYERKPYIGILLSNNGYNYVIPLTSAKSKHLKWRNVSTDRFLIYEYCKTSDLSKDAIYSETDDPNVVKHIISAIDLKKMIPICDSVYSIVDMTSKTTDSEDERKYKDLLNKEYAFIVKIIKDIVSKASRLYDKQIFTGNIQKFACDFKLLEQACDEYQHNNK